MADPLSIASGIAGLITLADVVIERTYKIIIICKRASEDARRLLREVQSLVGVLKGLHVLELQINDHFAFQTKVPATLRHECQLTLERLRDKLSKADPQGASSRVKRLERTLKWPLTSSELKDSLADIERYKTAFDLTVSMDTMNALLAVSSDQQKTMDDVSEIKHQLNQIEMNKERREALEFFRTFDSESNHQMSVKLRLTGTGLWLINSDEFQHWLDQPNTGLWLYGIPGAGKTILASLVIEEISQLAASSTSSIGVASFYCDYKKPKSQLLSTILASLTGQLARQHEECFMILQRAYKSGGDALPAQNLPDEDRLKDLLQSMIRKLDEVAIIVDGVDECQEPAAVADTISKLVHSTPANVKVCMLSRDERGIRNFVQNFHHVSIAAQSSDLRLYVSSEIEERMRRRSLRVQTASLKDEILETLVNGADGMFRWVACQMDHLCRLPTDAARRKALKTLPPDLDSTYDRLLERVNTEPEPSRILVERVLQWLVLDQESDRRLNVSELCEAVAFSSGDQMIDPEARPPVEDILWLCSSLVRRSADLLYVEFAHFTVEEYLKKDRGEGDVGPLSRYWYKSDISITYKTNIRLTYLNMAHFEGGPVHDLQSLRDRVRTFPLYHYAAVSWVTVHDYKHLNPENLDNLKLLLSPDKSRNRNAWAQALIVSEHYRFVDEAVPVSQDGDSVIALSDSSESDSDANYKTYIHPNSRKDVQIVKGIDPSQGAQIYRLDRMRDYTPEFETLTSYCYASPLHLASKLGVPVLVEWLLQHGSRINESGPLGTPLLCAILGEDSGYDLDSLRTLSLTKFVREQSAMGMSINAEEHKVIPSRRLQTVEVLLSHGADLWQKKIVGSSASHSPCFLAVSAGLSSAVVKHCRQFPSEFWQECLSYLRLSSALTNKYEGIAEFVKLVRQDQIDDIDLRLYHQLALAVGIPIEVAIASDLQASSHQDKQRHVSRFLDACSSNDISVAKRLHEALDLDVRTCHWGINPHSPLAIAVINNAGSVAAYLLDHGVNATEILPNGNSLLHAWFTQRHFGRRGDNGLEVLERLIRMGINVNGVNLKGQTPIHMCIENGEEPEFTFLLNNGADTTLSDANGDTCWHYIARSYETNLLSILKGKYSDVGLQNAMGEVNKDDKIPLAIAASQSSSSLFESLRKCDANSVHWRAQDGSTMLHFAARGFFGPRGREKVVFERLMESGVDGSQTNKRNETAMHWLASAIGTGLVPYDATTHPRKYASDIQEALVLMKKMGASISVQNWNGEDAFRVFTRGILWGTTDTADRVKMLVDMFLEEGVDPFVESLDGTSSLNDVINGLQFDSNAEDILLTLLDAESDGKHAQYRHCGEPMFVYAARYRCHRLCSRLLEACYYPIREGERTIVSNSFEDKEFLSSEASNLIQDSIAVGDLMTIKQLVRCGTNLNAHFSCGSCTAILHALACKSGQISHFLLDLGVDVNGQLCAHHWGPMSQGWYACHLAATHADTISALQRLLARSVFSEYRSLKISPGWSPLHAAATNSNQVGILILLKHGFNVNALDDNLRTPMHEACAGGDLDTLRLLIGAGANLNAMDYKLRTPLAHAIKMHRDADVVQLLLDHTPNIGTRDIYGDTPLGLAAQSGDVATFALLAQAGVDVAELQSGSVPALLVLLWKTQKALGYVVNRSHLTNITALYRYRTILSTKTMRIAIKRFAHGDRGEVIGEVNALVVDRDRIPSTPLYLAAARGSCAAIKLLLQTGACINIEGGEAGTPLMAACVHGRFAAVKLLIDCGALEWYDKNGVVLSAVRCAKAFPYLVRWLLVRRYAERKALSPWMETHHSGVVEGQKTEQAAVLQFNTDLVFNEERVDYLRSQQPCSEKLFMCRMTNGTSVIESKTVPVAPKQAALPPERCLAPVYFAITNNSRYGEWHSFRKDRFEDWIRSPDRTFGLKDSHAPPIDTEHAEKAVNAWVRNVKTTMPQKTKKKKRRIQ